MVYLHDWGHLNALFSLISLHPCQRNDYMVAVNVVKALVTRLFSTRVRSLAGRLYQFF